MYQVVTLFGEYEPWWFFEDWKEEIVSFEQFDSFSEANQNYHEKYIKLIDDYENYVTKKHYLTAFWNEEESVIAKIAKMTYNCFIASCF